MNQLDKLSSPADDLHRDEAAETLAAVTTDATSAAGAECENVCAVESSPALDLAAVADAEEEAEDGSVKNYHAMIKL